MADGRWQMAGRRGDAIEGFGRAGERAGGQASEGIRPCRARVACRQAGCKLCLMLNSTEIGLDVSPRSAW